MRLITQIGIVATIGAVLVGVVLEEQAALIVAVGVALFTLIEYLAFPKKLPTNVVNVVTEPEIKPVDPASVSPPPVVAQQAVTKPDIKPAKPTKPRTAPVRVADKKPVPAKKPLTKPSPSPKPRVGRTAKN